VTTPAEICPCNAETWSAFQVFRDALLKARYGPGRGLWVNGKFQLGYAAGRLSKPGDVITWPNVLGKLYWALHCTSLTNVFLSWLDRRNEDFTHGGNVPDLMELLAADATPHVFPQRCSYRGFRDQVTAIAPDGSGAARTFAGMIDMKELLARGRAGGLPTFMVFSQSTKQKAGHWNKDHHTGVLVWWEGRLFRLAADGLVNGAKQYSAQPVSWSEITDANVARYALFAYRVWGVDTADGSYGDQSRPIAEVGLEGL
jgi:hypothetical protein